MPNIKQTLSYLLLGKKGGENRIQIIERLGERPYNLNQMSEILDLNYRTVKHHIEILLKNGLISTSKTGGYGEVYFLTPKMEDNMNLFEEIVRKLTSITSSPRFFQHVMEQTHDAVIIIDNDGSTLFWNESAERLYGYKEEEVLGKSASIFPYSNSLMEMVTQVLEGNKVATFETKGKNKIGELMDIGLTIDAIKDGDGNNVGFSIMSRDISVRKRAERALQENEERFRHTFQEAPVGMMICAMDGLLVQVNPALSRFLGYSESDLERMALHDITHPKDLEKEMVHYRRCCNGESERYQLKKRFVDKNGRAMWGKITATVMHDEAGKPNFVLGIIEDNGV